MTVMTEVQAAYLRAHQIGILAPAGGMVPRNCR